MPVPDAMRNPPELWEGLEFYLNAFYALNSCRQIGMGRGPIPWTAVLEYGRLYCETAESFEDLQYHVRALDAHFLNWHSKNNNKE